MAEPCLLYYITDRTAFRGDEFAQRQRLLEKISEAASWGVDYIQLREKDLPARELESLAREAVRVVQEARKTATDSGHPGTALLVNSRTDIAMAAGADGVHLRSEDVAARDVRTAWECGAKVLCGAGAPARGNLPRNPIVAVSSHSPEEVTQAAANSADFAVFAPVFEKKDTSSSKPAGLALLREACRARIPVLALGGITLENAKSCLDAGAAGIAAIRLFQENDIGAVVHSLRRLPFGPCS